MALSEHGHGPSAIADALGATRDAVKYQLRKAADEGGVSSRYWTERETQELRELAERKSPAEAARALGRTEDAVRRRASLRGITWGRAA